MISFPDIRPVALSIGPVDIYWYGISYVVGIFSGWLLLRDRGRLSTPSWSEAAVSDLVFYSVLGGILGGRLGYVIFYNLDTYLEQPLDIFALWQGGMSIHGGMVGMALSIFLYTKKANREFFQVTDFVLPAVPIGLFFGRLANFVNQELWGTVTNLPWGVIFTHPGAGGVPRHPTQIYEAILEGFVLFLILRAVSSRNVGTGYVTGCFFFFYGVFRSAIEFLRVPDAHIGYIHANYLTMGHVLSIPLILFGLLLIVRTLKKKV